MIGLRKEVGPDVLSPQSPYPLSEIYHTDFFMAGAWAWPLAFVSGSDGMELFSVPVPLPQFLLSPHPRIKQKSRHSLPSSLNKQWPA